MRLILTDAEGNRQTRAEMRSLSLTDKIRALEAFQVREYARLETRAKRGGRSIPRNWQRWARAQEALET